MGNIAFGGLASGLDTASIIQQLLALESRPINLLNTQRETLRSQQDAYKDLNTRINGLENAAFELTKISSLLGRQSNSSDTDTLLATANANALTGSYQIEVLQLATASRLQTGTGAGSGNTLGGIADATDFSGESMVQINLNNRLRETVTEGSFFVNGQSISVLAGDTLDDVLNKVSTATAGAVTGDLVTDPAKGGNILRFSSASPIVLSQGTSNFLSAFKLDTASYSGGNLESTGAVDSVRADLKLDNSAGNTNLAQSVGSGILTLNNVAINYDASNDTLNDLVQRINASEAGVRASFSQAGGGRLTLVSKTNGPLAIQLSDTGNLANAFGLQASDSLQVGKSAQLRVDGGAVQSFNQNTGVQADGAEGLVLDLRAANVGNPVSVTVAVDTEAATSKIQSFVDQYNQLNARINELTAYNPQTGSKGVLLSDFSVNNLRQRMNDLVFRQVSGLDGSNSRGSLSELGLSTGAIGALPGSTTKLEFSATKFQAALEADPTRVAQLLGAEDTSSGQNVGVMTEIKSYLDRISSSTGIFSERQRSAGRQIDDIGDRIQTLNERLDRKQARLEAQFTLLERTLADLQAQQSSLAGLF